MKEGKNIFGKVIGNPAADLLFAAVICKYQLIISSRMLEETLQPEEEIGTRILHVQGFTQHSETKLWIKTQLIDKATGKVLDEGIQWITIKK